MKRLAYALLSLPNAVVRASTDWRGRPVFHDVSEAYPALATLQAHSSDIRAEFLAIRGALGRAPRYHEVDAMQKNISRAGGEDRGNWRVFFFQVMGRKVAGNCAACPATARLLDSVPGVFQACFSILERETPVPRHASPYNGYLRYHLALQVPLEDPPRMRVRDRWVEWREGHGFLFDDTWEHEIVNTCRSARAILMVDVPRPMAAPGRLVHRAATFVMRHTYARQVIKRSEMTLLS